MLAASLEATTRYKLSLITINTIFWFFVISAGFLDGAYFPILNKIFLERTKKKYKKVSTIYAADVLGSAFGAFLPSVFLIPILGIYQTLLILGLINVAILFMLLRKCG